MVATAPLGHALPHGSQAVRVRVRTVLPSSEGDGQLGTAQCARPSLRQVPPPFSIGFLHTVLHTFTRTTKSLMNPRCLLGFSLRLPLPLAVVVASLSFS